jgi:HEAT repeats
MKQPCDEIVRQKAVAIIKNLSAKEEAGEILSQIATSILIKNLEYSTGNMCWNIACTLWNILSQEQVSSLMEKLNSDNLNSDLNLFISVLLGKFGHKESVPGLIQAIQYPNDEVRYFAAYALGQVKEDTAAQYLPNLLTLLSSAGGEDILNAIRAIQANCKFYDYEIWQAHLTAQKADHQTHPSSDPNAITIQNQSLTIMTDKAPIFNQQYATIGVNYAAEGSKVEFTQHTSSSEQTFEILLTDYQQFIQQLQQKYPTLADATTIPQIIEVEAKLIEAQDRQRWQNFLTLKRLWNGGKKATFKLGEHFTEDNLWGKMAIAFLEGISEDGE